jgi:uncharacterized phage protein (TIGR01671 family)
VREIEFRGKTIKEKEWIYGGYSHHIKDERVFITTMTTDHISDIGWHREVLPETVGQYTGLKDQDRVKIFEGDIVKGYSGIFKVCFVLGKFVLADIEYPNANLQLLETLVSFVKVIGNIHDNPELMEVRHD